MREFGATARTLLEQAAAEKWGVEASDCAARNHQVVRLSTGETFEFGDLVEVAAALPVPAVETLRLKDPKDFRYIGKEVPIVDLRSEERRVGKECVIRVDLGGRRSIKKKNTKWRTSRMNVTQRVTQAWRLESRK